MALIGPNAVFWFSTGTAHAGHAAIAAIKLEDCRIAELSWVVQRAAAAARTYTYDWSGVFGGTSSSGRGRGINVLARAAAARWRIVHEHLSAGPAA